MTDNSTATTASDRTTLADDVLDRLREDIINGHLQPSTRLRFEDLSARYGVSVSPLREALSRLTAEELVYPDAQRGYRVAAVSLPDLIDILESHKTLEALALRLAIASGDDAWEGQVVAAHHRRATRQRLRGSVDPRVGSKAPRVSPSFDCRLSPNLAQTILLANARASRPLSKYCEGSTFAFSCSRHATWRYSRSGACARRGPCK
jgi:DNA-binding transcriptional MocR family regulator